jgi:hypothetical protein
MKHKIAYGHLAFFEKHKIDASSKIVYYWVVWLNQVDYDLSGWTRLEICQILSIDICYIPVTGYVPKPLAPTGIL